MHTAELIYTQHKKYLIHSSVVALNQQFSRTFTTHIYIHTFVFENATAWTSLWI